MTKKLEIYKCPFCGNIVCILHSGNGQLVCCGQPMVLQKEGMSDGALEKHVPVIEKKGNGYLVKVGAEPHPMVDNHYIEWIEIITSDKIYRKFLKPNEKPEAFFDCVNDEKFTVREYCNLHGLYKKDK
ncbi:MAG TPA: desulfoferrodoxin [Rickettsiales bacterium]|nr:desulfoferrodoxin [Rickettsiales bacterium]